MCLLQIFIPVDYSSQFVFLWLAVVISLINQLVCMFEDKFVLLILICFQCEPASTMDSFHMLVFNRGDIDIEIGFIEKGLLLIVSDVTATMF